MKCLIETVDNDNWYVFIYILIYVYIVCVLIVNILNVKDVFDFEVVLRD